MFQEAFLHGESAAEKTYVLDCEVRGLYYELNTLNIYSEDGTPFAFNLSSGLDM